MNRTSTSRLLCVFAMAIGIIALQGTARGQINSEVPAALAPVEDPACASQNLWEGVGWTACGLAHGLFVYSHTDLVVPGPMPITIRRTYRSADSAARTFGPGWDFDYAMYLYSPSQAAGQGFTNVDLIMPDGGALSCNRTSTCTQQGCTDYTDAAFSCTGTDDPTWYASIISYDGTVPGWDLTRKDGTVYVFGLAAPLQKVRDRYGNQVTIARSGGQTGNITSISSSNNRYVTVSYSNNLPSSIKDQAGRTVKYGYDGSGRLSTVTDPKLNVITFGYSTTAGQTNDITSIKDANLNTTNIGYLTTGSIGSIGSITLPDASAWSFSYGSGTAPSATVTDAKSTQRAFWFNSTGYTIQDTLAYSISGLAEQNTFTRDQAPT